MLNLNTNQLDVSISSGNYCHQARNQPTVGKPEPNKTNIPTCVASARISTLKQNRDNSKIHWVIWKNNGLFPNFWQWLMTCCKTEVSSTLTDDQLPLPFCCLSYLVENTTHWLEFHLKQRSCYKKKKCSSPWDSHITPVLFTWHLLLAMYSGACLNIEQFL